MGDVASPNQFNFDLKEVGWDRHPTLLGSEHLYNLTYHEGKAVDLKNIEKEVGSVLGPTSSKVLSI